MDKEKLLAPRLEEDDVEIPGVGTVRIRALSRFEVLVTQRGQKRGDALAMDRSLLLHGMVDPVLTEDEITRWQKASPAGEIEPITRRIAELSGIGPGSDKEAYKSVRGESDAGIRVLPGGETVDDGGSAASGDEL